MSESSAEALATRVVRGMLDSDAWSRSLGIEVVEHSPTHCVCRMTIRPDMVNGLGVAHGGVAYSLADSAFAFACNAQGLVTFSIENTIAYPAPVRAGDVLTATAGADAESRRVGYYRVTVVNQDHQVVALFRGTAYRTARPHFPNR